MPAGLSRQPARTGEREASRGCASAGGEREFRLLSEALADAVIIIDGEGRVRHWNPAAERMFGHAAAAALGSHLGRLIALERSAEAMAAVWNDAGGEFLEFAALRSSGEEFPVAVSAAPCGTGGQSSRLVLVRDLSEGKRAERLLQESRRSCEDLLRQQREMEDATRSRRQHDERLIWQLMHYDALTGLPNRQLVHTCLSLAVEEAKRADCGVGVLILDLDHFKYINDTLGHAVGDFFLNAVAATLAKSVGAGDTVARLSGDEFALVLPGLERDGAVGTAEQLLAAVCEPVAVAGHELVVTASIGVCVFPADGTDPGALLKNADAAMRLAKREGRNNCQVYTQELNDRACERLVLEQDLRRAMERREFELHYQPQVDPRSGRVDGAEALIRWRRPGHGMVSPAKFIPLAEETGLIVPIGEWVLETACGQLKAWQERGSGNLRMAVNLSVRQVGGNDLAQRVRDTLERTGLAPDFLELEITESMLMQNPQQASTVLRELKEQGIRLAIDDFGTGYSSLNYLKRFPIDTLKIDQGFVREIPRDASDAAIARAVIALGHGLHLNVVAEGVETESQLRFMLDHGCDKVQGYFFSRPVEAGEFERLLAAGCLPVPPAAVPSAMS